MFEDKNNIGEMLTISQFGILREKDLLTISNIDFDVLLPSFQEVEHNYETYNRANWFLIELLNAFDKARGSRKDQILKTSIDFSNWISEAPDEEFDYQVKLLNKLQTVKRWRDFNNDEITILYNLVENPDTREDCIVGAYLLLGLQQAAEIHFAKLTEEEQKNFKEFPIYHFWKIENS